jgi:hypothetical protein
MPKGVFGTFRNPRAHTTRAAGGGKFTERGLKIQGVGVRV